MEPTGRSWADKLLEVEIVDFEEKVCKKKSKNQRPRWNQPGGSHSPLFPLRQAQIPPENIWTVNDRRKQGNQHSPVDRVPCQVHELATADPG